MSMSVGDVARLLAMCAAIDKRTIGETDALAWHAILGNLDYAACKEAVVKHYGETNKQAMPADIKRLARTTATATGYICRECAGVHGSDPCDALLRMPGSFREAFNKFRDSFAVMPEGKE